MTTRNDKDPVTAHRALHESRGPDGGLYLPLRNPSISGEFLVQLKKLTLNNRIAQVLNQLFQTKLTGWDIDFAVGRNPVKLVTLRHRITIGEFWHNPDWTYDKMETSLSHLLCKEADVPGNWIRIAIRIAVLTAVSLELDSEETDVAVVSGDFLWPISAWYARQWGLPMGNIVICCNENQNLWDLICHGQMRTDSVSISTELPEADITVPADLERLIFGCGGMEEVERYLDCCRKGAVYFVSDGMLSALRQGLFVSVVSSNRMRDTIPGVLSTHGYLLSPGTALAYSGLLDYRAKKGTYRPALVISCNSPLRDAQRITGILGITEEEMKNRL